MTTTTERQVRREERYRVECVLLRAVARAAQDLVTNREGATMRGLEATLAVWQAWQEDGAPAGPRRGGRAKLLTTGARR